jgi:hypothetical protein
LPSYSIQCIENPSYRRPLPAIPHHHQQHFEKPELAFVFMLSSFDSVDGITTSSWIKYLDSLFSDAAKAGPSSSLSVALSKPVVKHRKYIKTPAAMVDSMEYGDLKIMASRLLMCAKDLSVELADSLDNSSDVINLESKVIMFFFWMVIKLL